jgi:hypothetical protein
MTSMTDAVVDFMFPHAGVNVCRVRGFHDDSSRASL